MARARQAGFAALVVTIDTPVAGMRERDTRNGMKELMSGGIFSKIPFLPQILSRPGWLVRFLLDGGVPHLPNVVIPGQGPMAMVDVGAALASSTVTWQDLRWIREAWSGPIVIKGVLTGEDARRAIDEGASAIVVSNHGGRQLDYSPATLHVLPGTTRRDAPPTPDAGILADYHDDFADPAELSEMLDAVPGVVSHGLFPPSLVTSVLVGRGAEVEERQIA